MPKVDHFLLALLHLSCILILELGFLSGKSLQAHHTAWLHFLPFFFRFWRLIIKWNALEELDIHLSFEDLKNVSKQSLNKFVKDKIEENNPHPYQFELNNLPIDPASGNVMNNVILNPIPEQPNDIKNETNQNFFFLNDDYLYELSDV